MSKKFSAARKRAFLHYLAESGNQTLAAERAKVSRSWVRLHRSRDAAFDAACAQAIAAAKEKLRRAPDQVRGDLRSNAPPVSWKYLDGAELVVRGTGGARAGRRVQIARARIRQWTPRVEERFLGALAASCNVKAACAEAGMSLSSAYAHRHRWRSFAQAWDEAVAIGYARLEAALVEAGCNLFSPDEAPLDEPRDMVLTQMRADQAIHLLHMHKHAVHGLGKAPGGPRLVATDREVADALEKRVAQMNREIALGIGPWKRREDEG